METVIERPRFSCALGGALATIGALPDIVPITHTALGCGGNLFSAFSFGAGYFGSGYCSGQSVPSSGITETEIVFGGTERLTEQIQTTQELIKARLFIVATGCMTEMIGDDVKGVVAGFQDAPVPVISINTPSFVGNSYKGYEIVLKGVFVDYLDKVDIKKSNLVNIFGLIPGHDPFFRGDLEEIKRLLELLGLEVNTFFTPDQTFENITGAPCAALNILLSQSYGREFVEEFEEKHGVPFINLDVPIGPAATQDFLEKIAQALDIDRDVFEKVIKNETDNYYRYFERTADMYGDGFYKSYLVVVGNANYAIPYAKYAYEELGWIVPYIVITDLFEENQKEILREHLAQTPLGNNTELIFEQSTSLIHRRITSEGNFYTPERYFNKLSPLFVFGSTLEKDFSNAVGGTYLPVSYPVYNRIIIDRGYAGYRGGLHFFEDIIDVFVANK